MDTKEKFFFCCNILWTFACLTGKQLCQMNIVEGMFYAFFAALTVLIVGVPVSVVICMEVSKNPLPVKLSHTSFHFWKWGCLSWCCLAWN